MTIPETVRSIQYGRKYESVAVEHYAQKHMENAKQYILNPEVLLSIQNIRTRSKY